MTIVHRIELVLLGHIEVNIEASCIAHTPHASAGRKKREAANYAKQCVL